jgi:hypothetical protein
MAFIQALYPHRTSSFPWTKLGEAAQSNAQWRLTCYESAEEARAHLREIEGQVGGLT